MQEVIGTKWSQKLTTSKFFDYLDNFLYGYAYPVILAFVTVFCYVLKLQLGGIALFFLLGSYILATHRDATPILPIVMFFIFLIRDISVTGSLVFYLMLIPPAICLLIHFIRFPLKHFNFGRLFLPLSIVTVALFMGGLLSQYIYNYAEGLLYTIPLGPVLLFIYLYFANYIEYPEDFDIKQYFALIITLSGVIISLEYLYYYYSYYDLKNTAFGLNELGCGNINIVGTVLLIAIPAVCYLAVKSNNLYPHILLVLAFFYITYKTGSDGCLGIEALYLPVLCVFVFISTKGKNHTRFKFILFLAIVGVLALLLLLIVKDKMNLITDIIKKAKSSDRTRNNIYADSVRVFLENPLFGAGFGYHNHQFYNPAGNSRLYNAHSTLFQVMGSMGMFGLIAYVYYFYSRFAVLMHSNNDFNMFTLSSFVLCSVYGFVDTVEFSTIPTMIFLTLLVLITEFSNVEEKVDYPIYRKYKKI